jgi:hypothetical protein
VDLSPVGGTAAGLPLSPAVDVLTVVEAPPSASSRTGNVCQVWSLFALRIRRVYVLPDMRSALPCARHWPVTLCTLRTRMRPLPRHTDANTAARARTTYEVKERQREHREERILPHANPGH